MSGSLKRLKMVCFADFFFFFFLIASKALQLVQTKHRFPLQDGLRW
jgi:hypothetical protein